MAKKRTVDADSNAATTIQIENTDAIESSVNETVSNQETEVSENPQNEVPKSSTQMSSKIIGDVPENIQSVLKIFARYPELYVTKEGGVFTTDTKLPKEKGAIIYKNPFHNS